MISQLHANKLLQITAGVSAASLPSYVYLGLCSSEPDHATGAIPTGAEPTAASYERKMVSGSSANTKFFSTASGGIITNSTEIQMITARESWGTQYYWFLSESATGPATMWGLINDGAGVEIGEQTVPVFYEGELRASIDVKLT